MGWHSGRIGGGIEPRGFSLHYGDVFFGSDVEANGPVDHGRIPDIDVFIDSNTDFRVATNVARTGVQGAPDVRGRGLAHLDHAKSLAAAAHLVMYGDIEHCRIAAVEAEIFINHFFCSGVLDLAAFAGRKLTHQGRVDRLTTVGDTRDVHERRNAAMPHVTGIFTERSFRFDPFGGNSSLNHNFRRRGDMQIHRLAANDL